MTYISYANTRNIVLFIGQSSFYAKVILARYFSCNRNFYVKLSIPFLWFWHFYLKCKTFFLNQYFIKLFENKLNFSNFIFFVFCFLARLIWKLLSSFVRRHSLCLLTFYIFRLLRQNHWASFIQTWRKASFGERNSIFIKLIGHTLLQLEMTEN